MILCISNFEPRSKNWNTVGYDTKKSYWNRTSNRKNTKNERREHVVFGEVTFEFWLFRVGSLQKSCALTKNEINFKWRLDFMYSPTDTSILDVSDTVLPPYRLNESVILRHPLLVRWNIEYRLFSLLLLENTRKSVHRIVGTLFSYDLGKFLL